MTEEPKRPSDEIALREWIAPIPNELPIDAVGLWQIIPAAREELGLEGDDLIKCVKYAIAALLERGAKPVRGRLGRGWIEQTQYGSDIDEIIENIVGEWRGWDLADATIYGLWFALPEMISVRCVGRPSQT
jgi:hypothetical protein